MYVSCLDNQTVYVDDLCKITHEWIIIKRKSKRKICSLTVSRFKKKMMEKNII